MDQFQTEKHVLARKLTKSPHPQQYWCSNAQPGVTNPEPVLESWSPIQGASCALWCCSCQGSSPALGSTPMAFLGSFCGCGLSNLEPPDHWKIFFWNGGTWGLNVESPWPPPSICMVVRQLGSQQCHQNGRPAGVIKSAPRFDDASKIAAKTIVSMIYSSNLLNN